MREQTHQTDMTGNFVLFSYLNLNRISSKTSQDTTIENINHYPSPFFPTSPITLSFYSEPRSPPLPRPLGIPPVSPSSHSTPRQNRNQSCRRHVTDCSDVQQVSWPIGRAPNLDVWRALLRLLSVSGVM